MFTYALEYAAISNGTGRQHGGRDATRFPNTPGHTRVVSWAAREENADDLNASYFYRAAINFYPGVSRNYAGPFLTGGPHTMQRLAESFGGLMNRASRVCRLQHGLSRSLSLLGCARQRTRREAGRSARHLSGFASTIRRELVWLPGKATTGHDDPQRQRAGRQIRG